MNTGKKSFTEAPLVEKGRQRESSLKKVISQLPARTKDNFLLLFLLALGISGFVYILMVPVGQKSNQRSLFDKIFNPAEIESLTSDSLKSDLLKIGGQLKVDLPMEFSFNKLSTFEGYKVNFGDKTFSDITSHKFNHTYIEPGTYKVELFKVGKEKDTVVHCEFLVIN